MDSSPAVEERIRQKAVKLERFNDRIVGCTVVVEAPHRHHHKGKLSSVRVDISVPGKDMVVDRAKPTDPRMKMSMSPCGTPSPPRCAGWRTRRGKMRGEVKTHASGPPAEG